MNLNCSYKIPSTVMTRTIGDETVILDLAGGTYFGLDPVGARIWQLIEEGNTSRKFAMSCWTNTMFRARFSNATP